jgi:hypothetical protein
MVVLGQWKWLFVNDFEFNVEHLSTLSKSFFSYMSHVPCSNHM